MRRIIPDSRGFDDKIGNMDLASEAKKTLAEFTPQIFDKLREYFESEKENKFGFNEKQKILVQEMLEHTEEFNLRNSKTLRGAFVKYGYLLGGGKMDERIWKAAMSVQIVHGALLMHDDFMDEDEVRRGKPTSHKYWEAKPWGGKHYGESMAVDIGDAGLMLGFQLLLDCGFPGERVEPAIRQFLRGIANTAFGQAYDVSLERMKNWSEEDVIVLHKAKTAIYTYENPLFIGAHLAGLPEQVFEILHEYAMDGGVAFQLQDDILGVYGTPEKTGKSADADLKEGKCTVLVLKALKDGTKEQKTAVERVWGNHSATQAELSAAKLAIEESGSAEYNRKLAREYAAKAAKSAEKLRVLNLNKEAIDFIQGIAEYMVKREV